MNLHKILKWIAFAIGIIAMILFFRIVFIGDEEIETSAAAQASAVEPYMFIAYAVFAIALVLVVLFVLGNIFSSGEKLKKAAISIGAFAVLAVIAYVLADKAPVMDVNGMEIADGSTAGWVGMGLYLFYILAIIAVGAMLLGGVKKIIKK